MAEPRGPYIPSPEGLNAEFNAHAMDGVLHLQRCERCGSFSQPPRYRCGGCGSGELTWVPSPGRGTLFSWAITHRAYDRGWADRLPYITGVIELEEGVRLLGAVEGVEPAGLVIGRPLRTRLEPRSDEFVFITLVPTN